MKLSKIIKFIKDDILVYSYFISLILVLFGLYHHSNFKYFPPIIIYILAFAGFYFLVKKIIGSSDRYLSMFSIKTVFTKELLTKSLPFAVIFCILFMIAHLFYLGHIPLLTSYFSLDYYKIAFIRQSIVEVDLSMVKYISAFMLKAIVPFYLLLLLLRNKKLFFILLVPSVIYALALMQKSYIVGIFVPCIIYFIVNFDFKKLLFFIMLPLLGNYLLVFVTNPQLRATKSDIETYISQNKQKYTVDTNIVVRESLNDKLNVAGGALVERVFLTTGYVVGYWFDAVPEKLPYAKGCGYHFLAPIIGCDFKEYDYSRLIYDKTHIKEAAKGLKGTVTVACFMYDYANFGILGLVLSAIILALLMNFINRIFNNDFAWIIALNGLFILWLTSAALSTTLLSGGWGITILLYWVYKKLLENKLN
jgi:hypothetical protein